MLADDRILQPKEKMRSDLGSNADDSADLLLVMPSWEGCGMEKKQILDTIRLID